MNGTYALADEDMLCLECDRPIMTGTPYAERLDGFAGDTPVVEIICVYCAYDSKEKVS